VVKTLSDNQTSERYTLVLENKLELFVVEVKAVEVTLKQWVVVVDEIPLPIVKLKVAQLLQ
jgi:hypothetical protein